MKKSTIYLTTPLFADEKSGISEQITKLRGEILASDKGWLTLSAESYSQAGNWKNFEDAKHIRLPGHKIDYIVDE